ncbi:PTPRJ phosphatase, partial [Amia calva]|nr:PTPRJ phosphatase [Amia calva]
MSCYTKPGVIRNLTLTEVTTSSVSLNWNEPEGNRSYFRVEVLENGANQIAKKTTTETSLNVTGLTAGINYTFRVNAVASDNSTEGFVVTMSCYTKPGVIRNLTLTEVTTSSVCLNWNEPEGNRSYFRVEVLETGANQIAKKTTTETSLNVTGLTAGINYTFRVIAVASDNSTEGFVVTISCYTSKSSVITVPGTSQQSSNVTSLHSLIDVDHSPVAEPQGNCSLFSVRVRQTGKINSANNTFISITSLAAGTEYTFSVTAVAADYSTEGPNPVQNLTSTVINTSSVMLQWQKPVNYSSDYTYSVKVSNSSYTQTNTTVSETLTVGNLESGTNYTFTVTTLTEDGTEASSSSVSCYTRPFAIENLTATTINITTIQLTWKQPQGYKPYYKYLVTINNEPNVTLNETSFMSTGLTPGTPYSFSVFTLVANETNEDAKNISAYTRPMSVNSLHAGSVSTEIINLLWTKPDYYKPSYQYRVNSTDNVSVVKTESYNATGLIPGKQYNFTVTTLTSDNTEGESNMISVCTNAAEVQDVKCTGPNGSLQASLEMSWTCPNGFNEGFQVFNINNQNKSVDRSDCKTSKTINFTLGNLDYNKQYSMRINTLGCGEMSSPVNITCQTGITDPPPPTENIVNLLNTSVAQRFDTFIVAFNSQLFSDQNGPIVAYGVLISSDTQQSKPDKSSLSQTYEDWNSQKTTTYLATIVHVSASRAANIPPYSVAIGAGNTVDGYFNGKLVPRGTYRVAIAAFTKLEITSNKINVEASYVSITIFSPTVTLNENPAVIGGAVGGTLTALLILICITVIAVVYWRRRAVQKSCDVPLDSMSSLPIRVEDYEGYYKKQRADSSCGFAEEFEDLKIVGTAQSKNSAEAQENKGKNRYNNVLPYDSSRVKLSIHGSAYDDYINANYMPGYNSKKEFIAAQGPLPGTVNEFWRMIWEKNVHSLVMLTRCNEQGRVKCEEYWPSGTKNYGNITVTMTSDISLEDWTLRDFNLKNMKTSEIRSLRQFHFTAWPDHGVPETTELLINFRHLVREHMDQYSRNSPTVVHCSAGVGRTGTFIAIDRLIYQIERESMVDVYGIVHDLRMHRPLMVQTEDQYIFLNNCAMDLIKARTGTNVDLIYQNTAALNIYENFDPEKAKTKNGYKV